MRYTDNFGGTFEGTVEEFVEFVGALELTTGKFDWESIMGEDADVDSEDFEDFEDFEDAFEYEVSPTFGETPQLHPVGTRVMLIGTTRAGEFGRIEAVDGSDTSVPYHIRTNSGEGLWAHRSNVVEIPHEFEVGDIVKINESHFCGSCNVAGDIGTVVTVKPHGVDVYVEARKDSATGCCEGASNLTLIVKNNKINGGM